MTASSLGARALIVVPLVCGLVAASGTATALPARDTGQLAGDVRAVETAGALGVLARTDSPYGPQAASAGHAEVGTPRPVPPNSRFRIGSTTKTFVAVVMLQLAAEGRLLLDDTVEHRLPGVVAGNGNDGSRITIRQLLQHTSGLHDVYADPEDFPQTRSASAFRSLRYRTYTPAELVAIAMRHPPDFAPDTNFGYSNTNYHLAALIIERITGNSWQHEVMRRIVRPFDLRETTAPVTEAHIPGTHPHAYRTFPDEPRPVDVTVVNPSFAGAAGAMISTARDLNRFFAALITGRLLPPPQLAEMQRTVPTAGDVAEAWPGSRYGLGLMWIPLPCGGYWSHAGDTFGYSTRVGITPDARFTYSLMVTNEATVKTDQAVNDLAAHALCP